MAQGVLIHSIITNLLEAKHTQVNNIQVLSNNFLEFRRHKLIVTYCTSRDFRGP